MKLNQILSPWIGYSILFGGFCLVFCCIIPWPLDMLLAFGVGWAYFLVRVLPQITVNVNGVPTGVVGLAGFVLGLHLFARWFAGTMARPWRWRWTIGMTTLVVVMFAAGIATVGSVHQVGWLETSSRPLFYPSREGQTGTSSSNNLKQMALAENTIAAATADRFSPGFTTDSYGQPLHGWQAALLPYLELNSIHKQIRFDLPWDAPENKPALQSMVRTFLYVYPPPPEADGGYALSHYAGNIHVLPPTTGLRFPADFRDGIGNTIVMGEVLASFRPWGHPLNLRDPANGIRKSADAFAGPWNGMTQFAFADGSVRAVRNTMSPAVLKALATPAGGEDVSGIDW